jgi:TP901 family phage tail tape measure protein
MSVNLGSAYGVIELDASGVESAVDKANSSLGQLGGGLAKVGLAAGAALITTAAAGAAALASVAASGVSMAKDLEAQMSGIQAVMGATIEEAAMLKETILELGIDPALKVTTLEAAAAVEMLGRNGLKTQEILDGAARATVLLANATGGEFGQSADIATDVMAQFNFQASEMEKAVDGITSVITNSKFTITDYQFALANAGGVAASVGVEFDDFNTTVAAIAPLFASGATAGAGLQRFLSTLNPTSKPAIKAMQELGIWTEEAGNRFYDSQGNLKSMAEIAGILEETLSPLSEAQRTQALTTIFGARAMRVAVGLMNTGEEGFRSLQETMGDTSAAENAAIRMDNLAGAIEILMGIIDTVKIRIGDAFLPVLKDLADAASLFVSQHSDKFVGFFEKIADVITAFVSGSPGDYPWEDIFPPWLADLMYEIAGLVEGTIQIFQDMRDGVFGVDYPWEDVFPEWAADIAYKITDAIKFFQDHAEEFEAAIKAIGVTLAAAGIAAIVTTIAGALLSLVNPVTIVLGLVGLLAAAWEGNWLGIRDKVQPIIDEIIPKIQELASSIGEFLGEAKEFVGDFISGLQEGEDLLWAFLGALENLGVPGDGLAKIRELGELLASFGAYFGAVIDDGDTMNDWLTHLPEPIRPVVEAFGGLLVKIGEVGQKIGEFVGQQGGKIAAWVEENRPLIEEFAQRIGVVIGVLAFVWAKIQTAALGAWDVILPILGGLVDLILGLAKTIMQVVTGDWEGAWETIKETAVKVWDAIKEAATNFGNWVAGWFGTSLSGIKETWSENWERLKEIVGLVWDKIRFAIRAKWREVKQAITEPINNLLKEWSNKWEVMKARVERAFILVKLAIIRKWEEIKTGLTDGIKNFVDEWIKKWFILRTRVAMAWIQVKIAILKKWDEIVSSLEGKVDGVVNWAKETWDKVKSTISGAWEGIKALLEQKVREMFETMGLDYDEYKARWAAIWEDVKLVVSTFW